MDKETIKKNLQFTPVICLYIIGFVAITMLELLSVNQSMASSEVKVSFSWNNLVKQLPSLVVSYVSLGCYTAATIMMQISKFRQNNADYLELESKISNFSKTDYRPIAFNKYCVFTNRNRKIKAYNNKNKKAWQRLEKHQTDEDYEAWCDYITIKAKDPTYKTENKYCKKRERLERLMKPEYVENNIDKLSVRYDPINASLVLGGVMSTGEDYDADEYITKNKVGLILSEQLPRVFMMIALISIASSITVDAFQINKNWTVILMFCFKMLIKIYSLINTIFSAIRYTEIYNERVTMKDIRFRWGICCEYKAWLKQQAAKQQSFAVDAEQEIKEDKENKSDGNIQ